jgi:hypothetical protein
MNNLAIAILAQVKAVGGAVEWLPPDKLRVSAPHNLAEQVKANKSEILNYLATQPKQNVDMYHCAHCLKHETPSAIVYPFGCDPATWLHAECWRDWFNNTRYNS